MNSPLQGGAKRKVGWDGPSLAGPRGTRRRLVRWLAAGAGLLGGVAAWLVLGTGEIGDSSRVGVLGPLAPGGPERSAPYERTGRDAEAAVSLGGEDSIDVRFEDPPRSGIVFDVGTGEVLWHRRVREEGPIASLTKIMSALIVTERLGRLGRRVEVDSRAVGLRGSGGVTGSAVGIEAGMRIEASALFQAMMVSSANDAATALAIEAAGSTGRFVRLMNRRARLLELECTRFVSPHGLEPENRSCAADLAAMTRLAMDQPRISRVARRRRAVVDFPIEGGERHLATTNPLLQAGYEGTIGLKTGFTEEAGQSLAAVVRRDGRAYGCVLLDSPNPAEQARRLLDLAF
jgi:serine-type D-Ala-D-Ala carboxypeptidase (penicillin-binding protein 5/6)